MEVDSQPLCDLGESHHFSHRHARSADQRLLPDRKRRSRVPSDGSHWFEAKVKRDAFDQIDEVVVFLAKATDDERLRVSRITYSRQSNT